MLISIVIPVYKVEEYIERCLQSVIAQDYEGDLECLLIDDCTPDNSCAIIDDILDRYQGPIEFRLLHHEKNRGLSAARNTGIDNAQGDYIYFLDSDDYISSDCISKLAAPLTEGDCDIVIGNYTILGTNRLSLPLLLGNRQLTHNDEIIESYIRYEWYMMAWNKLYKLTFIREHLLYFKEGIIHEDELWSFQCACLAQSLMSIDSSTYFYCIRNASIMTSLNEMDSKRCQLVVLKCMVAFLQFNCLKHSSFPSFLKNKYMLVRDYMITSITDGVVFETDFMELYRYVCTLLNNSLEPREKFLNFLIKNSRKKWASIMISVIHKMLVR